MITINNKSFNETACIRRRRNLNVVNVAIDGSKYANHQGFNYTYDVVLEQITQEELNFLEDLNYKFVFVDNNNRKINARILEDISIENKFYFDNEYYFNISLLIEEVVK